MWLAHQLQNAFSEDNSPPTLSKQVNLKKMLYFLFEIEYVCPTAWTVAKIF